MARLTSTEFARRLRPETLVILPVGATEEHGRHLALDADTIQASWAAEQVARAVGGLVAPVLAYGLCVSTRNYPGTVSISFDTVRALCGDILEDLWRNGVRRVMVLSGHAGSLHMAALRLAAEEAVGRHPDLRAAVLSDYEFAYDLRGTVVPVDDGHGGMLETSRVLAVQPRRVRGRTPRSQGRPPRFLVEAKPERHFPSGVIGDSGKATAAIGRRVNRYVLGKLVELAGQI